MMIKMCGGKEADGGEITKLMCQEENLRKYLDFFAFFKTLSKMCHLAMTERKGNVIKKKIVHHEEEIHKSTNSIEQNRKLCEALTFYKQIDEEINRLKD